ncbi:MAG TPA: DUF1501 domain-containing protein [Terriglobales bacterium]|nr:DUF1501 domain-containing protein [Terriglobales bacterium]
MNITRRIFVRQGALTVIGTAAIPAFLSRIAFSAESSSSGKKRMVVIFQRGAVDGLNVVIPHGESNYFSMRPTLAVPRQKILDLDGFFGLHPSMAAFQPLWRSSQLAIVHAAGSPDNTRSHFDAQDYMESGTPGRKSTEDGWLNRVLATEAIRGQKESPFRAVAMGGHLPRILSGTEPAVAIDNINNFGIAGRNAEAAPLANTFESMYAESVDTVLHGTGSETFDAVKMLKSADPQRYTPANGANYPRGPLGQALRQTAQLIKADLGVEVAFADVGGWDTHVNQGGEQGQLANRLSDFSQSIAAFWTDLGPLADSTVLVTMSEFGRTARENGTRGTDHGHANVMFVLGGPVKGGRVYGEWPGLAPEQLNEGRDLVLTTDFRRVLGEVVYRHLGSWQLERVFPGFENNVGYFLKLLG